MFLFLFFPPQTKGKKSDSVEDQSKCGRHLKRDLSTRKRADQGRYREGARPTRGWRHAPLRDDRRRVLLRAQYRRAASAAAGCAQRNAGVADQWGAVRRTSWWIGRYALPVANENWSAGISRTAWKWTEKSAIHRLRWARKLVYRTSVATNIFVEL